MEKVDLCDWTPDEDQTYFAINTNGKIVAKYRELLGLEKDKELGTFVCEMSHYMKRMDDIITTFNYFTAFYDEDKELFMAIFAVKFLVDKKRNMSINRFRKLFNKYIIIPTIIDKFKKMADDLYTVNVNTKDSDKYIDTPRITNEQAKEIVGISFFIRSVLPLCIHFSDTNLNFVKKKDYIPCFDKIFCDIIKKFETEELQIFKPLGRFVEYRVSRSFKADRTTCEQKQQLYGITEASYLNEVIHEVIIVKCLHKLDYTRSVVSFIDGSIFQHHINFKRENYKSKPVEIEQNESDGDGDTISHAEAIEMAVYKVDESNVIINDLNTKNVMKSIGQQFNIAFSEEEFKFYYKNVEISPVTDFFLHTFYSKKYFFDSSAIYNLDRKDKITLLIYMKKYLQLKSMVLVAQFCTAKVKGKYKENALKNAKFIELFTTTDIYTSVILPKFKLIDELFPDENLLDKKVSSFINSTFVFVDTDPHVNGFEYENDNIHTIVEELQRYFAII